MDYILEMKDICKSFGGVAALKNADLQLEKGHILSLIGGNGAGKSTLMKILTGVYTRDSGEILLDGKPVSFRSYDEAGKAGIRMIFQEFSLVPTLTVYENVFLSNEKKTKARLLDKTAMIAKTKELLESLGMDISPEAEVGSLSVGYCQMVEIAKALSTDAKILVLDEPTASLSDNEVNILFQTIRRLKEQGVSMIYISHRMNEILEISDDVLILRDGQVVAAEKADALTIPDIISHMLGDSVEKSFAWVPRKNPPSNETMLEAKDLKISGMDEPVSFDIKKGEILGIAGLMGSGRTEILQALFGMRKCESGTISIDGEEIKIRRVKDAIKAGVALVPENRRTEGLVLEHTVKENAILPVLERLKGRLLVSEKRADIMVTDKVRELNVKTDGIHKVISLLSGGNQQKIVIAKWLASEPKVLLLDEPTAGIDIGAKGEITEIIRNFADAGNSVIIVSSELVELMAVCDRILIAYKGRITGEFDRTEIASEEVLQHAIQG
ncbi:MAG: sugar ABC transporter ATP-binding protein [Oscillospiraceae bacterium]|nr:sugar ABC transporter ATP-binding protein [Oscillospiraceae bacterium]